DVAQPVADVSWCAVGDWQFDLYGVAVRPIEGARTVANTIAGAAFADPGYCRGFSSAGAVCHGAGTGGNPIRVVGDRSGDVVAFDLRIGGTDGTDDQRTFARCSL